ncbi:MAG TPA: DnaJ domain-containing protein [Candidatus Babeliales bacterium]|nr:DnaJ domain-containing protein [Candidatus Babeliales bacterium]
MKKLYYIVQLVFVGAQLATISRASEINEQKKQLIAEAKRALCADTAYEVIGVDKAAAEKTIKTTSINLLQKFHPDTINRRFPGDQEIKKVTEAAYQQINNAYDALKSNPPARFRSFKSLGAANTKNAEGFKELGFDTDCTGKSFDAKKPVNPSTPLYEKIASASPYEIYQQFNNLSIPAFAVDSFSKSGIQKEDFDKWANYAQAANGYVTSQINKGAAAQGYALQVSSLNDILTLVKYTAQKLKDKQIGAARKQETETELRKKLQEASLIEKTTFDSIARQNPAPADWIAKADSSKLMIQTDTKGSISYGSFFSQWDKLHQGTKGRVFTDSDFINFLKQNGITSKYKIADVADTLDQVIYRLQKDNEKLSKEIETSWFGNDGRKKKIESNLAFINTAQAIIKRVRDIYPSASSLQMAQISTTKDKVGTILYAQASIYQIALNKLMKEVQAL